PSGKTRALAANSEGVKKTIVDDDDERPAPKTTTDPAQTAVKPAAKSAALSTPDPTKRRSTKTAKEAAGPDVHEARPTESGDRSLIRALGLKIGKIVIDPGHGGRDTGTIGPNGLEEKDLVLDVSRRLGKLLDTRMGAEVIYTRSDDTFIPLEE